MMEVLIICIVFVSMALVMLPFGFTRIWFNQLRGNRKIYLKGISSAVNNETWTANAIKDKFGGIKAYRYPGTMIGSVILNKDGTGYYCGNVVWRYADDKPKVDA